MCPLSPQPAGYAVPLSERVAALERIDKQFDRGLLSPDGAYMARLRLFEDWYKRETADASRTREQA